MDKQKTIINQIEDKVENLADKTSEGASKLESKVLEAGHQMIKGTENLVDATLKGLHNIESQLKHNK